MKIIGIGNALVDRVSEISSDSILEKLELPKGSMTLIDQNTLSSIGNEDGIVNQTTAAGGSAANTINGLSKMGVKTAFIGKIGSDSAGQIFRQDQIDSGIEPLLRCSTELPTGQCLSLVSPCKERTMATYLGAAIDLKPSEIIIPDCEFVYIEGYLVNDHLLIESIMQKSRSAGAKVALDLASYNVVEENIDFLRMLIDKYVNIVFANEDEAFQYTGEKNPKRALDLIAKECEVAVVKIGSKGSLIASYKELHEIGVIDAIPRDRTGAGDLYASGFLYGITKGYNLKKCGDIGAILSSKVIEVMGPKMDNNRWKEILELVGRIEQGEQIVYPV